MLSPTGKLNLLSGNEVYVDCFERVNATVDRSGNITRGEIIGEICLQSKFGENEDLSSACINLSFVNPLILSENTTGCNLAIHEKINKTKWKAEKLASFKPLNGSNKFCLAKYQILGSNNVGMGQIMKALPLSVNRSCGFYQDRGTLVITCTNRTMAGAGGHVSKVRPIEDLEITCVVPGFVNSVILADDGSTSSGDKLFTFDSVSKVIAWNIGKLVHGKPVSIRFKLGVAKGVSVNEQAKNVSINACYGVTNYLYSGLKINRIELSGSTNAKIYKAITYRCDAGSLEYRV